MIIIRLKNFRIFTSLMNIKQITSRLADLSGTDLNDGKLLWGWKSLIDRSTCFHDSFKKIEAFKSLDIQVFGFKDVNIDPGTVEDIMSFGVLIPKKLEKAPQISILIGDIMSSRNDSVDVDSNGFDSMIKSIEEFKTFNSTDSNLDTWCRNNLDFGYVVIPGVLEESGEYYIFFYEIE